MKNVNHMFRNRREQGYTFLEMLIVVSLIAILAVIAVPNLTQFIQSSRISGISNELLRDYQITRTEAIKRQRNVMLCASKNSSIPDATCFNGSFNTGWIVFEDSDGDGQRQSTELLIGQHGPVDSALRTMITNGGSYIRFTGAGTINLSAPTDQPASQVVICDKRRVVSNGTYSTGRLLTVSAVGRTSIVRDTNAVDTANKANPTQC